MNVLHWFFPHYFKTNVFALGAGEVEEKTLVYTLSSLPVSILLIPIVCFNIMSNSPGPLSGFSLRLTKAEPSLIFQSYRYFNYDST